MVEKNAIISNPSGLHARPAGLFVSFVKKYDCEVTLKLGEKTADPKSILSVLALGLSSGKEITICADGENEDTALKEIIEFLENMTD